MRVLLATLTLLAATLGATGLAQGAPPAAPAVPDAPAAIAVDEAGWPVGPVPEEVADAAVAAWLAREPLAIADLAGLPPVEVCRRLPEALQAAAPMPGTRVVIEDRRELAADDPDHRSFTYAAVRPPDVLDVAQVDLVRDGDGWRVERVGFRSAGELTGVRAWLQTPWASALFVALSVLLIAGLARPSPVRRALAAGLATARDHRGIVATTMVLLYGVFALGAGAGAALPDECDAAVLAVVQGAIEQLGAQAAYGSGDTVRAAVVTFYQNFVVVTFSIHFFLSLLLGVPTYLVAIPQFFVLGLPFGLLGGASAAAWVPMVVLILLELTAYFLVVSGGGIVLRTLFRAGFGAYPSAARAAASLLVPAGLLLWLGAWYEAVLLVLLGL